MEFEDMQVIWNEQKSEKMFAINEEALYGVIKRKGRSIESMLNFVELLMITVNFGVAVWMIFDYYIDPGSRGILITGVAYAIYAVLALVFRRRRQTRLVEFPKTMMGELNRAIWQSNYMIRQGHVLLRWYLVPLALLGGVTLILEDHFLLGLSLAIGLPILTYYAMMWEYRKWHRPKRQELEGLRQTLTEAFPEDGHNHEL